jgi:hypothetical protein
VKSEINKSTTSNKQCYYLTLRKHWRLRISESEVLRIYERNNRELRQFCNNALTPLHPLSLVLINQEYYLERSSSLWETINVYKNSISLSVGKVLL